MRLYEQIQVAQQHKTVKTLVEMGVDVPRLCRRLEVNPHLAYQITEQALDEGWDFWNWPDQFDQWMNKKVAKADPTAKPWTIAKARDNVYMSNLSPEERANEEQRRKQAAYDQQQQKPVPPAEAPAATQQPPEDDAFKQSSHTSTQFVDPKDGKRKWWRIEGKPQYQGGNPKDPRNYGYEPHDEYDQRQPWYQKKQGMQQAQAAFETLKKTLGPDYREVLDALKRALDDWQAGQEGRQTKWGHVDNYIGGQSVQGSEEGRKRLQQDLWRDIDSIRGSGEFHGSQNYDDDVYKAAIRRRKAAEMMGQARYD